jgi:hypothetical protein
MGDFPAACLLRRGIQVIRLSSGRLKGERKGSDVNHFRLTVLGCQGNQGYDGRYLNSLWLSGGQID